MKPHSKAFLLRMAESYFRSDSRISEIFTWICLFEWAGMYD